MYIEANPRFKSLNAYDSSMQRVHSQSQKQKSSPEQSVKQETKGKVKKEEMTTATALLSQSKSAVAGKGSP
jgi:hypothetical protein